MKTGKQPWFRDAAMIFVDSALSAVTKVLSATTAVGVLFLYVTWVVPTTMWIGSISGTQVQWLNGGPVLAFLSNEFIGFIVIPLAPLVIACLLLSAVAWIILRSDAAISRKGFWGNLASACVLALFLFVPARASYLGHEVEALRQSESASLNPDGLVRLEHRTDHEILKLYRLLHEAGLVSWRTDPLAVVKFELVDGGLRHLHEDDDELTLKSVYDVKDADFSDANVELKNSRQWVMINLTSYWSDDHRVWMVESYRPLH